MYNIIGSRELLQEIGWHFIGDKIQIKKKSTQDLYVYGMQT